MPNELKKLPEAEKVRRAHCALIDLVNTLGINDAPSEALMKAIGILDDYIISLPITDERDIVAKLRFVADMIEDCGGGYPGEPMWMATITRNLADLRNADSLRVIGAPCCVWGGAAA